MAAGAFTAEPDPAVALPRPDALYRQLVETALEGIWLSDRGGHVLAVNSALAELLGYGAHELVGATLHDFIELPAEAGGEHLLPGDPAPVRRELRLIRNDGTRVWGLVSMSAVPCEDATREAVAIGTVVDITNLKDAEAALEEANEALEGRLATSAEDLASALRSLTAVTKELEAFSYSVSHDLRAPLRSIDGFSSALLEDYGERLPDEARGYLDRIRAASQRMGILIDELIALSRISRRPLRMQPVDLGQLVRDIATELDAGRDGDAPPVRLDVEDGLFVAGDPALLQVVVQNLLSNAWKFTSRCERPEVTVGAKTIEGRRVFFFADNGAGFDMQFADKLFRPFERLHRQDEYSGTGIGLSLVQRAMQRHGGRAWAEARPGAGATFHLDFGPERPGE